MITGVIIYLEGDDWKYYHGIRQNSTFANCASDVRVVCGQ
jgi:hypothetical protein